MYNRAYISSVSSVDGQAAVLNEGHNDHIAKLRNVNTQRAQGLSQKLLLDRSAQLLQDSKTFELHRKLCDLGKDSTNSQAIEEARRAFKTYRC